MSNKRYKINTPTVVSEVIDGEAVIVNMDNGSYYSLDDSGAVLWDLICEGASVDDLVGVVEKSYAGSDVDVAAIVTELIGQFVNEDLLVDADSQESVVSLSSVGPFDSKFTAPQLKKYTDMEELLLLDPIHDEGEATA